MRVEAPAANASPPSAHAGATPVPVLTLEAPPRTARAPGGNGDYSFASAVPVQVDLAQTGQWTQWDERRQRLRWELHTPQAQTLSLHFSEFSLPPGARLRVYDPSDLKQGMLELGPEHNQPHGQYWTPQFATQRLRIDVVFTGPSTGLALTLADINIAY